jgi:hypothetical protein
MYKIIEPEASDELIKEVQKQMGIVSDGILGPDTIHNIKELQFVCDIEVTGELNEETKNLIFGDNLNKNKELDIILN